MSEVPKSAEQPAHWADVKFSGIRDPEYYNRLARLHPEDERPADDIAKSHSFLGWLAKYHKWGMVIEKGGDITVSSRIASRFSIRIENDGGLALGIQSDSQNKGEDDLRAILTIPWSQAAVKRRYRSASVLILATEKKGEIRVRLHIPLPETAIAQIESHDVHTLRIRAIRSRMAVIAVQTGSARLEMPLVKLDFDKMEKIAAGKASLK